ncbi:MAG: hypothetical protein HRT90_10285 [Candidatus Margulisbacteria bacterium]|nr:hypothetical protein [Candidatus Margulisiibacteriota bacterium]
MADLSGLNQFVDSQDTKGFLRAYLQLVLDGYNLSIPSSLEMDGVKKGWEQVLQSFMGSINDPFLTELSSLWLRLVKQQGGKLTENFSVQMMALLDGKPKPQDIIPDQKEGPADQKGAPADAPAPPQGGAAPSQENGAPQQSPAAENVPPQADSGLDTVAPSISEGYYKHQTAEETSVPSKELLPKYIQKAIKEEKAKSFLIHYLSYSRYDIKPKVPLSSVKSVIQKSWEDILMTDFSAMPSSEFLSELSANWFYLVNQKGFPSSIPVLKKMLIHLLIEKNQQPTSESEKKESPTATSKKQKKKKKKKKSFLDAVSDGVNTFFKGVNKI